MSLRAFPAPVFTEDSLHLHKNHMNMLFVSSRNDISHIYCQNVIIFLNVTKLYKKIQPLYIQL